jgi:hypothetical protein
VGGSKWRQKPMRPDERRQLRMHLADLTSALISLWRKARRDKLGHEPQQGQKPGIRTRPSRRGIRLAVHPTDEFIDDHREAARSTALFGRRLRYRTALHHQPGPDLSGWALRRAAARRSRPAILAGPFFVPRRGRCCLAVTHQIPPFRFHTMSSQPRKHQTRSS